MIQKQQVEKSTPQTALPDLRPSVVTKDRQVVDTTTDRWTFRKSQDGGGILVLNWSRVRRACAPIQLSNRALGICKLYLAWRLGFSKGMTIRNDFDTIRRFLAWYATSVQTNRLDVKVFDWHLLDEATFRNFLNYGMSTPSKGNDFARLRDMYGWGAFASELPDFSRDLVLALKAISAQGNVKGAAVRFRDPVSGPFNRDEQGILVDVIKTKCGEPEDRAIVMLHIELGLNPHASARLKNNDLVAFQVRLVEEGKSVTHTRYQLAVPRVKKRTEHRETQIRPISRELGESLLSLRKGEPSEPLLHWLAQERPEHEINRAMVRFAEDAQLISPRTDDRLRLNARRFRYTLATEMAAEGASPEKIAGALDHTDLQNVNVYIEASSYVVDQVGKRFDEVIEPQVRAFRGKIVDSRMEPAVKGIPPRTIPSASFHLPVLPLDVGGIGMCGRDVRKDGLCRLAPPLTCYPCDFFVAFRDGPHLDVLNSLEAVIADMKGSADTRIPMQLGGVTVAIRQLLLQIANESPRDEAAR